MTKQLRERWLGALAALTAVAGALALIWWRVRWYAPVHEVEVEGAPDATPDTPSHLGKEKGLTRPLQLASEGDGPLFHRRYRAPIANPTLSAEGIMRVIQRNINSFVPQELARFKKTLGRDDELHEDDEFQIYITGPWNGPVHTIDVTPTSFAFATLEGHMEAGEIHFRIVPLPPEERAQIDGDGYLFEIASWARSRDLIVDATYDKLGMAKKAQQSMWTFFCQRVVEESGGELVGEIDVITERTPVPGDKPFAGEPSSSGRNASSKRVNGARPPSARANKPPGVDERDADAPSTQAHKEVADADAQVAAGANARSAPKRRKTKRKGRRAKAAPWERHRDKIDGLVDLACNFNLDQEEEYTEANGWRIDDYSAELPKEEPGEPTSGGSWELAKEVLYNYEFPDPGILTGFYVPDAPLEERFMLLRARFLFFTFELGVRIHQVIDELAEDVDGRGPAHVWGYSYYTLEGHFEMGEIVFTVLKFVETGEVEFHIHAYSRTGRIHNIFYRIGFALFGRWLQVRFSRKALERMQELVTQRLEEREEAAAAG